MPALYEIVDELAEALALIGDDGLMPDDLEARLDAIQLDLRAKADNVCRAVRIAESEAKTFATEAARLKEQADIAERRAAWLKKYLQECLARVGLKKLDTELFKLGVQANGRPSIRLAANAPIPPAFKRVREEFDSQAAYEAWKRGETLPADVVVEHGSHLRIR
jgi:hypothetical protein